MDKLKFYDSLLHYKTAMKQAKIMLEKGLISADDYSKIDTIIANKYGQNSCSIYVYNNLIYTPNSGNIHRKEVFITDESDDN